VSNISTDVLVVGGGPGGYVAAIECARRGLNTTLVEAAEVGGTCLNVGCIPSKALIHVSGRFAGLHDRDLTDLGIESAAPSIDLNRTMRWKEAIIRRLRTGITTLLSSSNVKYVRGWATMVDGKTVTVSGENGSVTIRTNHLILACGSRPLELAELPFGDTVISSSGALALTNLPESLVVVGAGYIGLELGTAFRKFGSEVTMVESEPRILPKFDALLVRPVADRLAQLGIDVRTGVAVCGPGPTGHGVVIKEADGNKTIVSGKMVLVSAGRVPATTGWNLETLGLSMQGRFIDIDARCETSMTRVYAIGDITGEPMLAHRAMAQARVVADVIAGENRILDHLATPAVCFTDPEVLSVGLSPDAADAHGIDRVVGTAPFQANSRALTLGSPDGFLRIVARADNRSVVGIQAVGVGVAELSSVAVVALEMGATIDDLTLTIQAHPTLAEVIYDAAADAARKLDS